MSTEQSAPSGSDPDSSCVVNHFGQLTELEDSEKALLADLEKDLRNYPAGTVLQEFGQPAQHFFALRSGWACSVRLLADGQRQVLDIYLPGQLMGLHEIGIARAQSELVALTDISACPFPRENLRAVFQRAPRLTEIFFLVLAREHAMLTERIVNIARRPANERLAHFLLEINNRLNPSGPGFELPMTQSMIGDALGLSAVHVSRTLGALRDQGLIESSDGHVELRNQEALCELSSFDPGYLDWRRHWLSEPAKSSDWRPAAGQEENQRNDQADDKQDPGDIGRSTGNTAQAQGASDNRNDQKGESP